MTTVFSRAPILCSVTALLFVTSLALLVASYPLGLAATAVVKVPGYAEKTNWSLQPLFWPILALLTHLGWRLYQEAWRRLPSHGVLWKGDEIYTNPVATRGVVSALEKTRPYLVVTAIVLGALFTAIDVGCLWREYGVLEPSTTQCIESDFTVAFRLPEFPEVTVADRPMNGWFVLVAYFLQGGLIAYGWLATLQLALHSTYFLKFETRAANSDQLALRLNYRDPSREFGLADVNRAINVTYSLIALGMLLPVLSAYWNPEPDPGQWLLRIFVPLILLVPAVVPIVERVERVKEASDRMRSDADPRAQGDFAIQRLWPFEGTQIGYIGKTAAAVVLGEYLYLITRTISHLF